MSALAWRIPTYVDQLAKALRHTAGMERNGDPAKTLPNATPALAQAGILDSEATFGEVLDVCEKAESGGDEEKIAGAATRLQEQFRRISDIHARLEAHAARKWPAAVALATQMRSAERAAKATVTRKVLQNPSFAQMSISSIPATRGCRRGTRR